MLLPSRRVVRTAGHEDPRAQGVGYRIQGPPQPDFREQVYEHDVVAAANGMVPTALINPRLGQGGFGIRLDYDRAALPCLIEWQCLQSGLYALGIEPSHQPRPGARLRPGAAGRSPIHLGHGEAPRVPDPALSP